MGRSYVIEHCITAANHETRQSVYKNYACECLRMLTEHMATVSGVLTNGEVEVHYMSSSVQDILNPKPKEIEKKLTAEQVIADIMADLGPKEVSAE